MLSSDVDKYRVIDTDTHVIEPYDLWTSRLPAAWGDRVPHVKFDEKAGEDAWFFGDARVGAAASAAQAGWHEYPPQHPPSLDKVNPATWDAHKRLALMDEYGIHAAVLYPNVAGFGAGKLLTMGDQELMLSCVRAYNDFLTDYCSADTERYVPISALPMWDIDLTVAEIERCAAAGHRGVIMTGEPTFWGLPPLADPYWDRLWAVCQDTQLSVNFHIGSGDMAIFDMAAKDAGPHANYAGFGVQFGMANVRVMANLITGGVCHRFPGTKFVSVESGIGWIPFAMEHLDWQWKNCGVTFEHPEYDLLPSEYFKRQMYGCFWFEEKTVASSIEQLGADWILYESDFPHPTSMAPGPATAAIKPRDYIAGVLGDLPDATLRKILHDNAAELYHLEKLR
jgi:predicted TIM-barrel fold metal-dependent hydrolase